MKKTTALFLCILSVIISVLPSAAEAFENSRFKSETLFSGRDYKRLSLAEQEKFETAYRKAAEPLSPARLIDPEVTRANIFECYSCLAEEKNLQIIMRECFSAGAGLTVWARHKKGSSYNISAVITVPAENQDFINILTKKHSAKKLGKASLRIKISCGADSGHTANLESESTIILDYKECNAVVWSIKDIHMGYETGLETVLKKYFPECLEKTSIIDPEGVSENSRILVAPRLTIDMRAVNDEGHNHDDSLYYGELKFDTIKYEK